ncbi:hypothetical protein GGI25_000716 [Coemansia spiralis]|uniref:C2H2-type domain-containing protein n=2 Tax=Coemansia TaxID=4863 RepID=A0A9W8G710_9FUNG|nr:hypothetical protein BX070DRAFT_233741 [Coemansia spiralis]KAJ1995739.1 hypothetical protein EDC05_000673 [Coemansia umbellata]KAJ2623657.1 hypothetical protein GGI26_002104 [Coemansia sp. RSA 1358]KAJ2680424.1 hypothetical protein GGI25_000716 [Coemansia spiralis]
MWRPQDNIIDVTDDSSQSPNSVASPDNTVLPASPLTNALMDTLRLRRNRRQRSASCSIGRSSTEKQQKQQRRQKHPLVITRVDYLRNTTAENESNVPALDICEIIRRKDERMMDPSGSMPQLPLAIVSTPNSASTDSENTLVGCSASQRTSVATCTSHDSEGITSSESCFNSTEQHPTLSIVFGDTCLPHSNSSSQKKSMSSEAHQPNILATLSNAEDTLHGRHSTGADSGLRRLRHDYFQAATMDGKPLIPNLYKCPIAMCESRFQCFEQLQLHWTEHPWNRGGILTPVCSGGIRRLGWWEHKKKYFGSLLQGLHSPEFPEGAIDSSRGNAATIPNGRKLHRRAASMDELCRSDYGDISLFGSRTYYVSPRVIPMWQIAQWEAKR